MGSQKKSFDPTHRQKLKERIKIIKDYSDFLKKTDDEMRITIQQLYDLRKEALLSVQSLNGYVKRLPNCPVVISEGCDRAISFMSGITDAMSWESAHPDKNSGIIKPTSGSGFIAAGTAVGGLTAAFGSSAAMAIATTFGTAGTGAAISGLAGVAATNAALAWLGGGTIAASGGGMAAGSALLAAIGPIGWGIGAVSLIGGSVFLRSKNDKKIQEIENLIFDLDIYKNKRILKEKRIRLLAITKKTEEVLLRVKSFSLPKKKANYNNSSFPREVLFSLVSDAKLLGKLSQERIELVTNNKN